MELIPILIFLCYSCIFPAVNANSTEKELMHHLMTSYGHRSVRPVKNNSHTIDVQLRLLVAQVINFDERLQQLTINGWLKLVWRDEYLQWKSAEWGGITSVSVSVSEIWKPDITFYENVDEKWESIKNIDASVTSNGTVSWYAPTILQVHCKVKVRHFPFDFQHCKISMASWKYDKSGINLMYINDSDAKQNVYAENGVWKLYSSIFTLKEIKYECCQEPYTTLFLELVLKRSSGFYITNIIIPCVLLSVLTVFVFRIPPESGEKISLGMTNVLALILFQQLIAEDMPPLGDEMPVLGTYFLAMIIMGCVSVMITVVVLRTYHYSDDKPIPGWIRYLLTISRFTGNKSTPNRSILSRNSTTNKVNPSETTNSGHLCNMLAKSKGTCIGLCAFSTSINKDGIYATPASNMAEGERHDTCPREEKTAVNWRHIAFLIDELTFYVLLFGMAGVILYVLIEYLVYIGGPR